MAWFLLVAFKFFYVSVLLMEEYENKVEISDWIALVLVLDRPKQHGEYLSSRYINQALMSNILNRYNNSYQNLKINKIESE